jgi:hypothetical protein
MKYSGISVIDGEADRNLGRERSRLASRIVEAERKRSFRPAPRPSGHGLAGIDYSALELDARVYPCLCMIHAASGTVMHLPTIDTNPKTLFSGIPGHRGRPREGPFVRESIPESIWKGPSSPPMTVRAEPTTVPMSAGRISKNSSDGRRPAEGS